MAGSYRKRLTKAGRSVLFYGEIAGFIAAWTIALIVASRQPATGEQRPPAEKIAAVETAAPLSVE